MRKIVHVDVDAMFVQCAVLADPDRLQGEELILVGGDPSGRGVVTSASYGCRAFGVRSAMPMATAVRLCPQAVVVPVPGAMIRRKSRELAEALDRWAPVVAMASVDEAYLELTGTDALYRGAPLEEIARQIQRDLLERTSLAVSIGGGTNRLVAKLATSRAKPAGTHIVPPGGEDAFVAGLELGDLLGVGPAMLAEMRRRGIVNMQGLRALDLETLSRWWGSDRARSLWRACRGIDDTPVRQRGRQSSISSEVTFRRDEDAAQPLERALLRQVVQASASLRKQGLFAQTISVRIRDASFRHRSRSRSITQPVQTDRAIFRIARELLSDLRGEERGKIRRIGITLGKLTGTGESEQAVLFEDSPSVETRRDRALAQALDSIQARHGRVIGPAAAHISEADRSPVD